MFHSTPAFSRMDNTAAAGGAGLPPDYESFERLLRLVYLRPLHVAGDSRLASYLALYLPEVASRIGYDDLGVLHLEMGVLKLAVRDAIARRDWSAVGRYFEQVARMMEDAGPEVYDAISVSLLGALFYAEGSLVYQKARTLLPEPLRLALSLVEQHYREVRKIAA